MTVSKIASQIYQAAKKAAKGVWVWRAEWSKAMKQAWRKVMKEEATSLTRIEIAEKIATEFGGRVWAPKGEDGIMRVYLSRRGYCQIENDGVNIIALSRIEYTEVADLCQALNIASYRR